MKHGARRDPPYLGFTKFSTAVVVWFPLFAAIAISVGFSSRFSGTFASVDSEWTPMILAAPFPAMQLVLLLAGWTLTRRNATVVTHMRACMFIGVVLLAVQAAWFRSQAGAAVTAAFQVTVSIGLLLTGAGFFMSKSKQNLLFGVRTPWTLSDARVWSRLTGF